MSEFKCNYDVPYQGQCQNPVDSPLDRCDEHKGRVCCSCGAPATRDCSMASSMVCGAPLCDDCEHITAHNQLSEPGSRWKRMPSHVKRKDIKKSN